MKAKHYFLKTIYVCYCLIMFLSVSSWASASDPNEAILRKVFSNQGKERLSGKATLLRTHFLKAISEDELIEGKSFADDQEKLRYINTIKTQTGLNFSLNEDKDEYSVEVLYFDGSKRRRDYAYVPPGLLSEIKTNPKRIKDLVLQVMIYTSDKTITITETKNNAGEVINYSN